MIAGVVAFGLKAWGLLKGLLSTPLGQLLAVAVVFGGLGFWHGENRYGQGVTAERKVWTDRQADDARKAAETNARNAKASQRIGAAVEQRQAEVRTVTQTIIREVPRYVTVEDDRRCRVGGGFVQLHDGAAASRLPDAPDPAGRPDDAAPGPALSAVAETVAANYGACNAVIEQVKGWQTWAREVGLAK